AVLDELERPHRADAADLAHALVAFEDLVQPFPDQRLEPLRLGSAFRISSIASSAAAQTTGLPPNRPPRLPGPGRSMTAGFPVTPPNGHRPHTALQLTRISGTVFQFSLAHSFPVRPMPACTSSSTSTMPWASHSLRRSGKNSLGGTIIPPSPWTGSARIAATRPAT